MKSKQYEAPVSKTVMVKMESKILQGSQLVLFWLGDDDSLNGVDNYNNGGNVNW